MLRLVKLQCDRYVECQENEDTSLTGFRGKKNTVAFRNVHSNISLNVFLEKTLITDLVENLPLTLWLSLPPDLRNRRDHVCALVFRYCMLMTETCLKKCICNSNLSYKGF